jgi:hypothetical protein
MSPRLVDIVAALAIGAALAYGIAWYNRPAPIPAGVTVEAKPAAEVKNEAPSVTIKPPSVKVFKPAVKTNLKLPASVTNDDNVHVLASSKTANDERPHTVTTTIDQRTGEVTTYDRTDPLPWLAVNTKSEIGVFYGLKHGEQALRIEGRQELLQIKVLHAGVIGTVDATRQGVDSFIGAGVWARW